MILTIFESVQRAYTRKEQIIDSDWDTIADFLLTFNQCEKKEDMQLFNLWEFDQQGEQGRRRIYENKEPTENYEEIQGTIRRCKANAKFVHGIVLDYDGEKTTQDALKELAGFELVLYTTFRHSAETNKFRIVLPFSKKANPDTFKRKKTALSQIFTQVDQASFSESQSFYLHSGPYEQDAFAIRCKGEFLDLDYFADEIIPERIELPKMEFTGDRGGYKETLIESLATCSGLHYNGAHKYNVLTLVALCKSAECSFAEYDLLCQNMMDPTSSLTNPHLRKTAWMGWNPHSGITKAVREEFISSHGGTSKFGVKENSPKMIEILNKYKVKEDDK